MRGRMPPAPPSKAPLRKAQGSGLRGRVGGVMPQAPASLGASHPRRLRMPQDPPLRCGCCGIRTPCPEPNAPPSARHSRPAPEKKGSAQVAGRCCPAGARRARNPPGSFVAWWIVRPTLAFAGQGVALLCRALRTHPLDSPKLCSLRSPLPSGSHWRCYALQWRSQSLGGATRSLFNIILKLFAVLRAPFLILF